VIAPEKAQSLVLEGLQVLAPVEVGLAEALGCVVAREVRASELVPGFSNSSMDGYALRAVDTLSGPTRLRVTGTIFAGDAPGPRLATGEAMRIMTGAPLPSGADSVSMIEEVQVEPDGQSVVIQRTITEGEFVRHPGEDVAVGQVLLESGRELSAVQLGVLAGQGLATVLVHPRPRVGVLSTGDELAGPGVSLAPGQIRDINRPMLLALLRQSGFTPLDLAIVADDEARITSALQRAVTECDAVISTGGVSVGDVDFVKSVLAEICDGQARWMQVAMRPGKPFAFGTAGPRSTPVFGLPGNPVSTRVSYEMFVRPALRRLAGHQTLQRPLFDAVLDCAVARQRDGKLYLVHVVVRYLDDGRLHVLRSARHGSHLLSAVADANALALVPDGDGLDVGESVRVMVLEGAQLSADPQATS
jgi:molybdenum cofactor synthesis domain-containing protein